MPTFRYLVWLLPAFLVLTVPGTAAPKPDEPADEPAAELPCPPGAYCERAPWGGEGGGAAWSLDPAATAATPSTASADGQPPGEPAGRDAAQRSPYPLSTKPDRLPYEPGDPIPSGYRRERLSNPGLLLAGGGVLGLSYLPWLAIGLLSLESEDPSLAYVAIPLAGPGLLALQYDLSPALSTALVVNGAVQGLGIALMIAAELAGDDILVRDARSHQRPHLTPWAGPESFGARISGAL